MTTYQVGHGSGNVHRCNQHSRRGPGPRETTQRPRPRRRTGSLQKFHPKRAGFSAPVVSCNAARNKKQRPQAVAPTGAALGPATERGAGHCHCRSTRQREHGRPRHARVEIATAGRFCRRSAAAKAGFAAYTWANACSIVPPARRRCSSASLLSCASASLGSFTACAAAPPTISGSRDAMPLAIWMALRKVKPVSSSAVKTRAKADAALSPSRRLALACFWINSVSSCSVIE